MSTSSKGFRGCSVEIILNSRRLEALGDTQLLVFASMVEDKNIKA